MRAAARCVNCGGGRAELGFWFCARAPCWVAMNRPVPTAVATTRMAARVLILARVIMVIAPLVMVAALAEAAAPAVDTDEPSFAGAVRTRCAARIGESPAASAGRAAPRRLRRLRSFS